MPQYVYPAIFHPNDDDGSYTVLIPSLPGCITEGKSLSNAIFMAEDAISMWLWDAENTKAPIPAPLVPPQVEAPEFVNFIAADTDEYRRKHDNRAVRKTLSIPSWLNAQAEQAGVNFSQVLQDGLKQLLGVQ